MNVIAVRSGKKVPVKKLVWEHFSNQYLDRDFFCPFYSKTALGISGAGGPVVWSNCQKKRGISSKLQKNSMVHVVSAVRVR